MAGWPVSLRRLHRIWVLEAVGQLEQAHHSGQEEQVLLRTRVLRWELAEKLGLFSANVGFS